jgi:O-antigen/teichoic acid export membrane protein
MNGSPATATPLSNAARQETFLAVRNALKLGASLICTWGTALAVKLLVPRYLGPDTFGALTFADAFTATFFVALTLGIDLYTRKEVSVRLGHAADFFGGIVAVRVAISAALFCAMAVVMHATQRPPEVRMLVYLFAAAQFFISINATLSAILHCAGRVDGVSIIAVVTKLMWAGGCAAAIYFGSRLWLFPASLLAGEVLECAVLYHLARRHARLRLRLDWSATWRALAAALPFASMAMALTPFLIWVYMPLLARAVARSREEFYELLRRELEYTLTAVIPVAAAIALGADLWISLAFAERYAPAVRALRILGPMSAVTYVTVIVAACTTLLDRGWRLTVISVLGLVVNIGLNGALIPYGLRAFGPGGTAAALASLGTEVFVAAAMLWTIGRGAVAVDLLLAAYPAPRRVALDALAYVAVALALRAVDVRAIVRFVASAMEARRQEG